MVFETFSLAQSTLLWGTFAIAMVMGAVVNKTNFCTMGAVSDWVNMGDTGRLRAWFFAIAVAMLGVVVLEAMGLINAGVSFPPYRSSQLIWAENLLGGITFGIGMTLASGCGNKCLIRIGGGNLKSLMVFAIIALIAYFMTNPFPHSDQTLMSLLFIDWIRPLAVDLKTSQDLGSLVSASHATTARTVIGAVIGIALLAFAFRSSDFRGRFDNVLGGLVVGLAVLAAWYVSSNLFLNIDSEHVSLRDAVSPTAEYWDMYPEFHPAMDDKPDGAPLSPQSFTFINPMGQTLGYALSGFSKFSLTFGIMAVLGVIVGSFIWSLFSKGFRIEWFASVKDFTNHFVGAILMGFGGVLAMGCTIGQGITGVSTLALGSFIALIGIIFGSALTMKIQYYRMVYEGEASFAGALLSSLADMRLLPGALRKLEKV